MLWNTLSDKGYDPSITFSKARVDPSKLGDGHARYNSTLLPLLWQAAIEQSGDEDLGIKVGKNWNSTTFHALGFAWLASSSLQEAFQKLVRYAHIVNNSLIVKFEPVGTYYRFSISTSDDISKVHPAGNDAGMVAIIQMCRLLVGKGFSPIAMELVRSHRTPDAMESFSGVTPEYNKDENAILIDASIVAKILTSGNASLAAANEQVTREYLLWLEKSDIVSAVKATIVELLPSGQINQQRVAEKLNINLRTMQRKLKEKSKTFKEIVSTTRQEIVHNHIRDSQLSLTEITYLLGFSDQANFTRAYKRWTGSSPYEHRKSLIKNVVNL